MKKYFLLISFFVLPATADNPTCGENGVIELMALFNPKTITCSENQFLPANSLTCSNCPNGYSCSGGELTFDEHKSSGIDFTVKIINNANNVCATNFPHELYALWKLKNVTCSPGYYLPANAIECVQCSPNHYCSGGIRTFNATTAQGTEDCSSGQNSACDGYLSTAELYVDDNNTIKKINVVQNSPMPPTDNNGDMLTPPTRPGYTFKGYYSAPTGGVKYYNADMTSAHVWDLVEKE